MSAGAPDFCKSNNYVADPNIDSIIRDTVSPFYDSYRVWEKRKPLQTGALDMWTAFGGSDDSECYLNKGDQQQGKSLGGVRQEHCCYFNCFVKYFKDNPPICDEKYLKSTHLPHILMAGGGGNAVADVIFRCALYKYFKNDSDLSPLETATLNGAILARLAISTSSVGNDKGDRWLFAIPGYVAIRWSHDINDVKWRRVDNTLIDVFTKTGIKLINLSGAIQLRLGDNKDFKYFRRMKIGRGMLSMGGM